MPYLRFNRDKRGYENTFVVHADKRRGRGRSRILYWFRTPPGVKVGRAALDEDAIRMIEEHNPEIDFDWTRILKGGKEPAGDRRPPPPPRDRAPRPQPAPSPPPPTPLAQAEPEIGEAEEPAEEAPRLVDGPVSAAEAKLGAEGLSRLRGRYAEMLARISERITDQERQNELKTLAERLNPDAWVTHDDVIAGLDSYEATFESLRSVVGHRRRRKRRRSAPGETAAETTAAETRDEPE